MSGRQVSNSKLNKKMAKYTSILKKLYGMSPASLPSRSIMVCNAGLSLGLNKEDLLNVFGGFGKIVEIKMISKESHAFIEYSSVADAENCFLRCNGKIIVPEAKGPLYLLYLESSPKVTNPEVFQTPPGCVLIEDFVTAQEEQILLDRVKGPLDAGGDLKQRRVAHFGYEFIYGKNDIDKENPLERGIPSECAFVRDRLVSRGYNLEWEPDQLTVNHYFPGQGIPAHIDTHSAFEDPILSLSLSSDSVMEFKRPGSHYSVVLPRRSLLVMSEESRYAWTHSIPARKSDVVLDEGKYLHTRERGIRVSFTFRRIRKTSCDCNFEQFCDSRLSGNGGAELEPSTLEGQFVHKVYEDISDHFSQTRHTPWPAVLDLVKSLRAGSILLDVGCGNCKYFGHASSICEIGSDHSAGLLSISHARGFQTVRNNCLSLPIRDGIVDCVICIAVVHHLSSDERRIHSIGEILRVLSDSGKALIYVWAKNQKYQGKTSNYLKYSKKNNSTETNLLEADGQQQRLDKVNMPVHVNGTDFSQSKNDVLVPWKLRTTSSTEPAPTFLRYYHVFDEGELNILCEKAGATILKSYYDNGNWCCLISKQKM